MRQRGRRGADSSLVTTTEYLPSARRGDCAARCRRASARWIEARPRSVAELAQVRQSRAARSARTRSRAICMLAFVASLGATRRGSLRHERETAHLEAWLADGAAGACRATTISASRCSRCRRLVKGYSDTHARGLSKFDRVMSAVPRLPAREDGAVWLDRLNRAALADEKGWRSTACCRDRSRPFKHQIAMLANVGDELVQRRGEGGVFLAVDAVEHLSAADRTSPARPARMSTRPDPA